MKAQLASNRQVSTFYEEQKNIILSRWPLICNSTSGHLYGDWIRVSFY